MESADFSIGCVALKVNASLSEHLFKSSSAFIVRDPCEEAVKDHGLPSTKEPLRSWQSSTFHSPQYPRPAHYYLRTHGKSLR